MRLQCDFVPTPIKQILPTGIETVDGKMQELDVIVCATGKSYIALRCRIRWQRLLGFDTSCKYGFPIVGRNGADLADKYTPFPKTYLGITTDGFPNFFHVLGPNSAVGAGSLLLLIERQVEYIVQAILKMQRERLKSMEVKVEAVDDFDQYLEVRVWCPLRRGVLTSNHRAISPRSGDFNPEMVRQLMASYRRPSARNVARGIKQAKQPKVGLLLSGQVSTDSDKDVIYIYTHIYMIHLSSPSRFSSACRQGSPTPSLGRLQVRAVKQRRQKSLLLPWGWQHHC